MADAGARVLNAQAVEFAKERGIAIYARATVQPPPDDAGGAVDGTVVRRFAPRQPGSVAAVVSERDVLYLSAVGSAGLAERVLELLDRCHAVGKQFQVHSPGGSPPRPDAHLTLVLSRENLHGESVLRRAVGEFNAGSHSRERISIQDELGAVSAIGAGINASYRNLTAGTACLRASGIAARGMATSSFRITWLVDRTQLDEAVRRLHVLYLESPSPLVP